jgi:hypothetical protein
MRPTRIPSERSPLPFAFAVRLARITSDSRHCRLVANIKIFGAPVETGKE